ncbi:HEPN domain-containing protein [Erwinia sp. MYb416]|uniref:HEPN domain-containing protein n=1 Tax=Erwinia sp. MYb416 TaxID=3108532 RepID=UPI0030A86A10
MAGTIVDRLHVEFYELIALLQKTQEISLISSAEENFKKSLLLAAASFFEKNMSDCVMDFVCESAGGGHIIASLVQNKAIKRQYHTWFSWDEKNANAFFSLFGQDFLQVAKIAVRENPALDSSIKAFLEVGRERNRLVHQDFGNFTLEKTTREIYDLYQEATYFVEWVPGYLREHSNSTTAA